MLINLSLVVRKPAFCICENKDADQLRSNYSAADQRRLFRYTESTTPLLPSTKFQASSHLLWLYSLVCVGLVGNPKDRFSHNEAHFVILLLIFFFLQYVIQFVKQLLKSMIEDVFIQYHTFRLALLCAI